DYGPLKRVGVAVSDATVQGRTISVNIALEHQTGLRLAIVSGDHIRAWMKRKLEAGSYPFKGRLAQTPKGSGPRLRITAHAGRQKGRQRFAFKVLPLDGGGSDGGGKDTGGASSGGSTTPGNHAPTAIALSGATLAENAPAGTIVGALSSTDQDL